MKALHQFIEIVNMVSLLYVRQMYTQPHAQTQPCSQIQAQLCKLFQTKTHVMLWVAANK